MRLYEERPQFSRSTGKPLKPSREHVAWLCDWCGRKIPLNDPDDFPTIMHLTEYDGVEPMWHELGANLPVDRYAVMNRHPEFIFCDQLSPGSDCSVKLAKAVVKTKLSIRVVIYEQRFDLLEKLLKGNYTLKDFDLE